MRKLHIDLEEFVCPLQKTKNKTRKNTCLVDSYFFFEKLKMKQLQKWKTEIKKKN